MNPSFGFRRHWAPMLSLFLIGGIWADRQFFHLPVGDPSAYHARIRAAAATLPDRIGEWSATRIDPPAAARALLKPNILEGREYVHASTGERATFMIVQCQDARDMSGHWPPNCYPSQGWVLRDAQERVLPVLSSTIPVTVYRFTIESFNRYSEIVVYNFFVRPDAVLESGQKGVGEAAENPRMKVFGAAQVQVAFSASMTEDRRDEVFRVLVSGAYPLIEAVLEGETR